MPETVMIFNSRMYLPRMKTLAGLMSLFLSVTLYAQQTDCRQKLDSAAVILSRTPSFRAQVIGDARTAYDELLVRLRSRADAAADPFHCFVTISRLFDPIRDNHLSFFEKPVAVLQPSDFNNTAKVESFRKAVVSKREPVWDGNTRDLQRRLAKLATDSVEGIYWYGEEIAIGVTRTGQKDSLVGVVLQSSIPVWKKGEVMLVLRQYGPDRFRAIAAQPYTRTWGMTKHERLIAGTLTETVLYNSDYSRRSLWSKKTGVTDHRNIPASARTFELRQLGDSTQYLRLGSFATDDNTLVRAHAFYDSVATKLTASRLVLDLRNNGGGGFRNSRNMLNQLEKFARTRRIHVIVNNRTYSNAEQFLVLLKYSPNVRIYGETTNGTLTYGSNTGRLIHLPGNAAWVVYPTDMKEAGSTLQYEDVGIRPHVLLSNDSDWIGQVIDFASH
ncbi:MAG: hypothetical protein EOO09_04270 [Chitinophagaceae bacterium]|nr:MAG: hypothetical protein EOO09_04270 [Chitinophagaceae bacterium]